MKKQIMSALGLAALASLGTGCEYPIKDMPEGGKSLTIPVECAEFKSTSYDSNSGWTITCKDDLGQDMIYRNKGTGWNRYTVIRGNIKIKEGQ